MPRPLRRTCHLLVALAACLLAAPESPAQVVRLSSDHTTVYEAQQFEITVQVELGRLRAEGQLLDADPFDAAAPPRLTIPWIEGTSCVKPASSLAETLRQRALGKGPGFLVNQLFAKEPRGLNEESIPLQWPVTFDRSVLDTTGRDGEPEPVIRYSLTLPMRAVAAGKFGPLTVRLEGKIYDRVTIRPDGTREAAGRDIAIRSSPLTIEVLGVPSVHRPASFTGGIGRLEISAAASPVRVRVGDPVLLTVRITGGENPASERPPPLATWPEWTGDFAIEPGPAAESPQAEGERTFVYRLRPRRSDVKRIPPVPLATFDPRFRRFMTTATAPIPIDVSHRTPVGADEVILDARGAMPDQGAQLPSGLEANYDGEDMLVPEGPYEPGLWVWISVLSAPAALASVTIGWQKRGIWRRRGLQQGGEGQAHRHAIRNLNQATRLPAERLPDAVVAALTRFFSEQLDRPAAELTAAEACDLARRLGAPAELGERVAQVIARSNEARFGRQPPQSTRDLLADARSAIDDLERLAAPRRPNRFRQFLTPSCGIAVLVVVASSLILLGSRPWGQGDHVAQRARLAAANATFLEGVRSQNGIEARTALLRAIAGYEELVAEGIRNGKLHFNLANAYFRSDQLGHAVLHYRLARAYRPRDARIRANQRYARSIVPQPRPGVDADPEDADAWLSLREQTRLALAMYVLGLGCCVLGGWIGPWLRVIGAAGLIGAATLGIAVAAEMRHEARHPVTAVASRGVVLRKGDGVSYEPAWNRPLSAGLEGRLVSQRAGWSELELPGGLTGWVPSPNLAHPTQTRQKYTEYSF